MKRLLPIATTVAAGVALAGCGSSGGTTSSSNGAAARAGHTTVSSKTVKGTGIVLVDHSGAALYAPDQERGRRVLCVGACTSIWKPLRLASGMPTGPGRLSVRTRPDGTRQVTAAGRPLYSFVHDRPGTITGNGASDAFGGRHFTWHVVPATRAPVVKSGGGSGGSSGGSYGSY